MCSLWMLYVRYIDYTYRIQKCIILAYWARKKVLYDIGLISK